MTPQVINIITNILGAIAAVIEPVRAFLLQPDTPFSWTNFGLCIVLALVNYFTGKSALSKDK